MKPESKHDTLLPGAHAMVYRYWRNEWAPAIVVRRYGYRSQHNPSWLYPDVIDVRFDDEPDKISEAHFSVGVEVIP